MYIAITMATTRNVQKSITDHNSNSWRCRDFTTRRKHLMGWQPILKQAGWATPWSHQDRPTDRRRHSRKSLVIRGSGCRNTPRNQLRLLFFVCNQILTAFAAWPVAAECGIVIRVDEPAPLPCLRPPAQTRKSSRCASLSRCPVCGCRCVFSQRLFGAFVLETLLFWSRAGLWKSAELAYAERISEQWGG